MVNIICISDRWVSECGISFIALCCWIRLYVLVYIYFVETHFTINNCVTLYAKIILICTTFFSTKRNTYNGEIHRLKTSSSKSYSYISITFTQNSHAIFSISTKFVLRFATVFKYFPSELKVNVFPNNLKINFMCDFQSKCDSHAHQRKFLFVIRSQTMTQFVIMLKM